MNGHSIPITEEEQRRRREAYAAAPSDKQAAAILGIDKKIFGQWRRRVGLPSKRHRGTLPMPIEVAVARLVRVYGADAVRKALEAMPR